MCDRAAAAGLEALALALPSLTSLEALDLSRNNFDGSLSCLPQAITRLVDLKHLNVQSSSIGDAGATSLCEVLREGKLPRIATLNLGFNNLSQFGFESMALALPGNCIHSRSFFAPTFSPLLLDAGGA